MTTKGKVFLVGAGPGDPELLTVKAVKHLKSADIILTDRLVSDDILALYAPSAARIIYVGKDGCNRQHSVAQQETNELIVAEALKGKKVVRLKGGDVAFFSNVLDELSALKAAGIEYEIVPGITAASGASAYAGMPLTARGYSRGVRFLTFSHEQMLDEKYWQELAETDDTLVFYMTGQIWNTIADHLTRNNIALDKKMAIIEQATTPYQKIYMYDLAEIKDHPLTRSFVSPSLVVVGKVVNLYAQFAWKNNTPVRKNYFKAPREKATTLLPVNHQSA